MLLRFTACMIGRRLRCSRYDSTTDRDKKDHNPLKEGIALFVLSFSRQTPQSIDVFIESARLVQYSY